MHDPAKSSQTELEYRLAWARTYLKKYGLINNSERGIWAFTNSYTPGLEIDPTKIVQAASEERKAKKNKSGHVNKENVSSEELENVLETNWKDLLHQALMSLTPDAFERLTKRLLRESGFVQVEVTGRSGDGGIDGKGILRLQNILSYHVVFQCKRYQGSVGSGAIRDFRGAMVGRGDKGIFITSGTFTRDAIKEATRDGAPTIDLIDGEMLAEMLKNLKLGVKISLVEKVEIDNNWFSTI